MIRRITAATALLTLFASLIARSPVSAQQRGASLTGVPTDLQPSALQQGQCLGFGTYPAQRHRRTRAVRFIGSEPGRPSPLPFRSGALAPAAAARSYMQTCGSLFGVESATADLAVADTQTMQDGRSFVRLRQRHRNLPVVGGELVVNMDAQSDILAVSGRIQPRVRVPSMVPTVTASAAQGIAVRLVAQTHNVGAASLVASAPELSIYSAVLFGAGEDPPVLAWRVEVTPRDLFPIREFVVVDATTGTVPLHFNQAADAAVATHTANHGYSLPGTLLCNNTTAICGSSDSDAEAAHHSSYDTLQFYLNTHGRDGITGTGSTLGTVVRYGSGYSNAFWNGTYTVYGDGDGFAQADDVVAHEITHGVTEHTSDLYYYGESGAINESFSDMWGEYVDLTNGRGADSPSDRWRVGEDITGLGAIRDMEDPTLFGDPDRMSSYIPGGDVHWNSGIGNKAAYLMVDGGTFNGYTINGIGITKAAKIYYEAQTRLLTSLSDYEDLGDALIQGCANLVGTSGILVSDCEEVRKVTLAVEIKVESGPLPPTISAIADVTIWMNTAFYVNFTVDDQDTPVGVLRVTATSSNQALVPDTRLTPGGSGAARHLYIDPLWGVSGDAVITVSVSDRNTTTTTSFKVTVSGTNHRPIMSAIADQVTYANRPTRAQSFTVFDQDTEASLLTLTAYSFNTNLVPHANVVFGGSGTDRTVTVSPAAGKTGTGEIRVTVSDGYLTEYRYFHVNVAGSELIVDTFTGADGSLLRDHIPDVNVPRGAWTMTGATVAPRLNGGEAGLATTGGGYVHATLATGVVDFVMGADLFIGTGTPRAGLVVRYLDANSYLYVAHSNNSLTIVRRVNGVDSTLSSVPLPAAAGSRHRLEVHARDSNLTAYWDGLRVSSGWDWDATFRYGTRHGLIWDSTSSPTITFDNFRLGGLAPTLPVPADSERDVALAPMLGWIANGGTAFDVALSTTWPPSTVVTGLTSPRYESAALLPNTRYYWQVTGHHAGSALVGPIWSFTTGALPSVPVNPRPTDAAVDVPTTGTALTWSASGATEYDVAFGTSNPPATVAVGLRGSSYTPTLSASTTYYWQVVARNALGSTVGRVWSFTTGGDPSMPAGFLVRDTFAGPPGTALTAHLPDFNATGNPWVVTGETPTPQLRNGAVGVAAGSGHLQATIDTGTADVVVSVEYKAGDGRGLGAIAFRLNDANNHWLLEYYAAGIHFFRRLNGNYSLVATAAVAAPAPGSVHRLELRASGSTLQGYWDNVLRVQATDTVFLASTRHGLDWNSAYDRTVTFDNLEIQSAGTPPSVPPVPYGAAPAANTSSVPTNSVLSWSAPGATSYDVAFGTSVTPPTVATGIFAASYRPQLTPGIQYYWRVTARNAAGSTVGPLWSFTTSSTWTVVPGLLLQDTFSDADGVLLESHRPDYAVDDSSWQVSPATAASVSGGRARHNRNGATWAFVSTGLSDVIVSADYTVPTTGALGGVAVRMIDSANNIFVLINNTSLQIWRRQSGSNNTLLATRAIAAIAPGSTHRISVETWASWIDVEWDGQWVVSAYAPMLSTETRHGLYWETYESATFDNVEIRSHAFSFPGTPGTPSPASGATRVSSPVKLSWSSYAASRYDVRLGTSIPLPTIATWVTSPSYTVTLAPGTTYYWQIVARNHDQMSVGPIWSFTTETPPAPATPVPISPADGQIDVARASGLVWAANGAVTYDLAFGTSSPPATVATGLSSPNYVPALAYSRTYYWQVTAHNAGGTTPGPIWSFRTVAPPPPPTAPTSPVPADNAAGVAPAIAGLTWSSSGAVTYDVAFGTTSPPPTQASGLSTASYTPGRLAWNTTYYWQVTARNAGGTTPGPLWSFTTAAAPPTLLVSDTFTGADGTLLTAHTPDVNVSGAPWVATGPPPVPTLTNNRVGVGAGYGHQQATINTGVADVIVSADYTIGTVNQLGALVFRLTDTANHLLITAYANHLNLWRLAAGQYTLLARTPLPAAPVGSTHRLEVRAIGSRIEGWWDNVLTVTATETFQQSATRHGLDWNSAFDATAVFDNLEIHNAAAPVPPPGSPVSPGPADAATGVATTAILTWRASGATSYDVAFGTTTSPPVVATGLTTASYRPTLSTNTTYYWKATARNAGGATTGPLWSFTTAATPPNLLVSDSFTGPNGTLLTAHVPDVNWSGAPWVVTGAAPVPTLTNNRVGVGAGSGHLQATIDAGVADVIVSADYTVGTTNQLGALALRLTDAANHLLVTVYDNHLNLWRRAASQYTLLGRAPLPVAPVGSTHRLEVRAIGSGIEGVWDTVPTLTVTETFQQSATRHGLDWNSAFDATATFDNFEIRSGVALVTPPTVPTSPAPADAATAVATAAVLTWTATGATSYDVAFGTTTSPAVVATGLTIASYRPTLSASTSYYWQVTARNTGGATTGPVWSFTTAAAPSTLLVSDTFTGANGTLLTAHTPDVNASGAPWVVTGASPVPTLTNNRVAVGAGSGHLQATIDTSVADVIVAADYTVGTVNQLGALVFRLTDASNHLLITAYANHLNLWRRVGGQYTLLAQAPLPAAPVGSTHRLEVRATGSRIEGWWNNVLTVTATETFQQSATRHGLDWNSAFDATAVFDNLEIHNAAVP